MLSGNTKILTVYYGPMTVEEIYGLGRGILVYSWDRDTKIPVVRMLEKVERAYLSEDGAINKTTISFDSGLDLTCNLDHKLYTFRGEKISAKDTYIGQSIRAFSISLHPIDKHLRAHGWVDGKAKHQYVARMVWECFYGKIPKDLILHHKDFNEVNNKLDNLELLTVTEHNRVHYPFRKNKGFFKRNHKIIGRLYSDTFEEMDGPMYNLFVDRTNTLVVADDVPVAGLASGIVIEN